MGALLEAQKQYERTIDVYRQALKITEQIGNKSRIVSILQNLARVFLNQGNFQKAEETYEKAMVIAREVNSKTLIAYSLEGLGNVYLRLRQYTRAEEFFRQALDLGNEVTQPGLIWRTSYGMAKVCEELGRFTEALRFYYAAIDEVEKVRARASSDEGKSGFLANHLPIYEDFISFLYRLEQKYPKKDYLSQAFDSMERAKARMFLDTLAEFQSGIRKGLNAEQAHHERTILKKISKYQSELREASTVEETNDRNKKLRESESELDQWIVNLKRQNPQYAQLKYPEPYRLNQVRKQLPANTVLLEFFVGEKESFVFALTSRGQQMESLPGRTQLEESIRKYRDRISHPPKTLLGTDADALQEAYRSQSRTLFHQLIGPVNEIIRGKENMILILDGLLHYVPFETLLMDDDRLLIEGFRITYAPSATIWASLQERSMPQNQKDFVGFADPVSSSRSPEMPGSLERLRYAREEVEEIAILFPETSRKIYVAGDATEDNFKSNEISQYRFVHFATHALIDENIPRRSGILLSPGTDEENDGFLQMHEIWNQDLDTGLVVLSACDTGLGKLVRGEGMVSLMRAFFYAGTKNVVVSLWNVDDKSTADLMKEFYLQMKNGKSQAESLRQAKLDMIKDARSGSGYAAYEDPYYWGPFILVGPGE